jgi:preprotein translocase subunit YajC
MFDSLVPSLIVLAQSGGSPQPPGGSSLIQFVPLILIFLVIWFLILRPQKKQEEERQEFRKNLKKGDEVVTSSGLIGKVASVEERTIKLEIARGTKVEVLRSQIQGSRAQLVEGAEEDTDEEKDED